MQVRITQTSEQYDSDTFAIETESFYLGEVQRNSAGEYLCIQQGAVICVGKSLREAVFLQMIACELITPRDDKTSHLLGLGE